MLETDSPSKGLLFLSVLYRSDLHLEQDLHMEISQSYGELISYVPHFNPLAKYYAKEMGEESLLKRHFYVSTIAYPRENLLTLKLQSLQWERVWSVDSKRMVNVDAGLISAENFILATTKNYAHRVFVAQNIFADLTYQCIDGSFQTLPWTYPDYKDQSKIDFLNWCRSYLIMLRRMDS